MANLEVSPDYLKKLSADLDTWRTGQVNPAINAIPADWGWKGVAALAAEGVTLPAVLLKWKAFKAKIFTVYPFGNKPRGYLDVDFDYKYKQAYDFTGEDLIRIINIALAGYGIYSALDHGDYYSAGLQSFSLLDQINYLRLIKNGWRDRIKNTGATTKILDVADMVTMGLFFCCGFDLSVGEEFTDGAKKFRDGSAALEALKPKESEWTGTAADNYAKDVVELQSIMGDIAEADERMAGILRAQMDQLTINRDVIDTGRKIIEVAYPIALSLYAAEGPVVSQTFQERIAYTAFVTTVGPLAAQLYMSAGNAARVATQTENYRAAQHKADALYAKLEKGLLFGKRTPLIRAMEGDQMPNHVWLWFAHGPVCGQTSNAAKDAEDARAQAGEAVAKVAARLAENLLNARANYTATDEEHRETLDKQM